MSAAAAPDLPPDEERRSPPVTLTEVLAACEELELAGVQITRRSVRDKLGRGSMTTIHNGVSQYESRQASAPPSIDLTQEDRNVIADLGARALAVAEGRVERILAQREAALQGQVTAANMRAEDAIAAAEASVGEAQRHTMEALATSETARQERDRALAEADEAKQHALRLEGELKQVIEEKERSVLRSAAQEDELGVTKAQLAAETALRQRCDADLRAVSDEMKVLRSEYAKESKLAAEANSQVMQALAIEQERVTELQEQRRRSEEAMNHLESELAIRDAALSQLKVDLVAAETTSAARHQAAGELAIALAGEQAKGQQLALILAGISEQTEALRSLKVSLASRGDDEL